MNYSLTQGGNLASIIGLIMLVLNLFKINIAQDEVEKVISAVIILVGVITSWIGRYRHGDLKLSGFKKQN